MQHLAQARAANRRGDAAAALADYLQASRCPDTVATAAREGARLAIAYGAFEPAGRLLITALRIAPAADLLALLAVLQRATGRAAEAMATAEKARTFDPYDPTAAAVIADVALDSGAPGRALQATDRALARHPQAAVLWRDQGRALLDRGEPTAAVAALRKALMLDPADAVARSALCLASLYDATLDADAVRRVHLDMARLFDTARPAPPRPAPAPSPRQNPATHAPLKVGLLSGDLRTHPVGIFIGPVLEHANNERVEWFAYANSSIDDAVTERLRARVANWRDVATLDDAACLAAIRADQLDVLIDLSGYTYGARAAVIAARAAPLQIAYLGYPAPSGLPGIDAVIADDTVMPPGSDAGWPERVLRLPHAFLCYEPYPETPDVAGRATDTVFTFASFNNLAKLDRDTLTLWARVLKAVPDARLLLCATTLGEEATRRFTHARFEQQGINPDRVDLQVPVGAPAQLLARYSEVDVALDPLRFNGGTTTFDALWQGVPVLTLPGAIMPARMAASILSAARLHAWIARDADHYVELAVGAAGQRAQLASLRHVMRARLLASALGDAAGFASAFVDLLEVAARSENPALGRADPGVIR